MPKIISPAVAWPHLLAEVRRHTPEIFAAEGQFLNLLEGRWQEPGAPRAFRSPIDGRELGHLPMLGHAEASRAVVFAKVEAADWGHLDLAVPACKPASTS
jgi:hypothetical protein